ncbi:MAG: tetratricopeptide repeat protein, partial [Cyanobacteria bacterium P01_E01_bin.42]
LSAFKREIEVDEAINNQQGIAIALNRMGGLLQQQGKYDEALSAFKREIEIDEAINNQQRLAIVLNRMGGLLQEQGRYDEAISAFERQIEVSEAINDQQGIAIALNRMGGLLQEQGRYDEAISAFERQIEVNKNLNNQQGIAIAFHRIGMLLNRQNRIDEAIDVFERQIKITKSISNSNFFKKNGSEVLIVHFNCLRIVRQLFQQYKKFKKAREIIVIQIEISEIIDNKKNLAIALNYMGKLLQEQGKYDEAISAFERQIKVSEAISDQKSIAIALTCIGGLLQRQGRYDEAIAIFEREIEIDEVLNDYRGVTIALQQIGKILEKQSQFDKAEQVFRRNYDLAFQLEDRQGQAIILKNLGRVLYKQGGKENLDFARIQLKESIRLCQELEDLENLAKVRIVMGEALLAYQKDEQAAIELIKGFEIEETLMNSKGVDIAIQPLIYVLVKLNREKETKQYFKRALAIAPDNQNILELQKQLLSGVLLKQGKVIKIKYNKNEQMYGWIMPSDRSDNIYFHEPFVNSDCVSQLKKGVQVEVFIKKAEKGYCATYIRILDDGIETPSA